MTRWTLRTTLLGIALAAAMVAAPAAGATAPGPWQEYRSAGFSVPAGARCPFALSSTVVDDHERIRTLETYPDGNPRTQQVVGQLVVRYTNEDTQQSVRRNLTGNALVELRPDRSLSRMSLQGGHFAVGFRERDPAGPAFLVFTGAGHSVSFADDGTRTATYGEGGVENICDTLAG
ncbi:MAG TPA: hypothetical protein VFD41_04300 [Actinomycetales bacterium]|nr:hypothetical protein [Actinomycetales bacterium]